MGALFSSKRSVFLETFAVARREIIANVALQGLTPQRVTPGRTKPSCDRLRMRGRGLFSAVSC
jgi:hypothetical protein